MAKICQKWTIFIKKTVKFDKNQQKINGFDQKNWRKINDLNSTITETTKYIDKTEKELEFQMYIDKRKADYGLIQMEMEITNEKSI